MLFIIVLLVLILALDFAALRWGHDSRQEWHMSDQAHWFAAQSNTETNTHVLHSGHAVKMENVPTAPAGILPLPCSEQLA